MDHPPFYWSSWHARSTSRRRFLQAAGGISVASVLAACTPTTTQPASQASPAQTTEGVPQILRHGIANPPTTFDPNATSLSSGVFYALYDALTRIDENANVQPALAESWRPIDDTTWEFKLRAARFSDGNEATAEDVAWTYRYILDPANRSAIASRIANVRAVEAVDLRTVRIVTAGPDPLLPKRAFFVFILPRAYIERIGIKEFGNAPIGTGAFKVKEYRRGERSLLVPSETSWRKPKLTELWLYEMPEGTTRVAALRTGEVDLIDLVDRETADQLKSESGLSAVVADGGGSYVWDIEYFKEPYADKRVRQAFNHAVDKEAILKNLLRGYGRVMDGQLIPKSSFGYNPNLKPYEYDPKKAKDLLAAAGHPNGFETTIEYNTSTPESKLLAEAMVQYFGAIGVRAQLRALEIAVWRQKLFEGGRAPFFYAPWAAPVPDPEFTLTYYSDKAFGGKPNYVNPAFQEPYTKSQQELDPKKREGYLQAAAAAMRDDPPSIFSIQTVNVWGVAQKIRGFVGSSSNSYVYYDAIDIVRNQ